MHPFLNGWYWGRGDQVAHYYVLDSDPSYVRSACRTRLDRWLQVGRERDGDERCRHCAKSRAARV